MLERVNEKKIFLLRSQELGTQKNLHMALSSCCFQLLENSKAKTDSQVAPRITISITVNTQALVLGWHMAERI